MPLCIYHVNFLRMVSVNTVHQPIHHSTQYKKIHNEKSGTQQDKKYKAAEIGKIVQK